MKRAYTYIIIGFLITMCHFTINGIDILHDSIGYLLIVLGVVEGEKQRPISEFIQAKYLGIALAIYSFILPFLLNLGTLSNALSIILSLLVSACTIYMFYSLLKAEYIWHPSEKTRQFMNTYLLLAGIRFASLATSLLIPKILLFTICMILAETIYLLYVFVQLRKQYQ